MLDLDQLLRHAVEQRASDVHLKAGSRPYLRVDGRLQESPFEVVEPVDTERVALAVMPPSRAEELRNQHESDFVYGVPGLGRFRVSAFRQRGFVGLVLRRVVPGTPGFDALGLPVGVSRLADEQSGLVLVTGLAGSGRTSTIAAIVDHVNQTRASHIVTIENPIEVLHPDKQSIVTQREVGTDTVSYESALRHALRQDPDVVMVGKLPDADTARAALEAADVGKLVISTMPTVGAVDTVVRLVEMFPPHLRAQTRSTLARGLRGIISMRLLPRAGGRGRVPAVEVLVVNGLVSEALADSDGASRLERLMADGDYYGMQTFDQSLLKLYQRGLVDRATVIAHATSAPAIQVEIERIERSRAAGDAYAGTAPEPDAMPVPAGAPLAPVVPVGSSGPLAAPVPAGGHFPPPPPLTPRQ
jgi:twitching motility protein PilT